ncbi:uncharacterized protein LOC128988534 [Macrosteles quadrilineatus]|uniref:uncharacterized protein LOC128988534 n=1 Tax=Macrosteles quadrilineatus TaxID=74068 RepID=UPI0023E347BA|nr:uncharacterized protein LOC128988534 [Macrosteles quadrilineatus]
MGQNEYFETVGNAGLGNAMDPGKTVETDTNSVRGSKGKPDLSSTEMPLIYDTKWENSSGKSILFSKSAIETIQGLDHSPIKIQVCRCATDNEEEKKNICEPLGYAQVRLPDHFSLSVLQSCKSGVILPVSCIHRDSCVLKNVFGVKKGEVQVFVRLSCFGTVITTSFQSVGRDRRYVFKPSPQPGVEIKEDSEINRDNLLKPIVAEEEVAVGITILKDKDIFQKPVVWRNNNQSVEDTDIDFLPKFNQFKDYSLRMPRASDASLCRNANPPGKKKAFCDWHDLVTKEVKNSLKNNCGCRDGMTFQTFDETCPISAVTKESPHGCSPKERKKLSDNTAKPSLMEKLLGSPRRESFPGVKKVSEVPMKPITGSGISSEPTDCDCDCDRIKNTLAMNPMMKYTWQVK